MVFYFTATGNSLHVAKQLDENPISIPQAMRGDNLDFTGETIGIVCPIFAGETPKLVWEFMIRARFHTDYLYLVLTYGMSDSDAPEFIGNRARQAGVRIDYIHTIRMVDNYLPSFDMAEEVKLEKHVDEQIENARIAIAAQKRGIPSATPEGRALHKRVAMLNKIMPSFNNGKQLQVTEQCVGCGICASVCPIGNFYIKDGAAKRKSRTCEFCLACAQNCPQKAIRLKKSDKNPSARYRNPAVTLEEIIQSNQQEP